MKKPIVIGVGEFLWDMLPDGKKAGGAPVNFAYHASQNGAEGWAVSAVGKDGLGEELVAAAEAHGINLQVEKIDKPTGTVNVTLHNGSPEYDICRGVAWDYIPLTEKSLALARSAGAISFGTLAQRNDVSRATIEKLVEAVPDDALRIFDINLRMDFYSEQMIRRSLEMANVLKINDEELEIVKAMFGLGGEGTAASCHRLIENFGLKMLILTGGSVFSSIYTLEGVSTLPTPKVNVIDSVGAGDSFSGALTGALLTGKSIAEAHRIAVDTAAYVCTCSGAWTPPRK